MIGTVAVTALTPGDVVRLEPHKVTGHAGPVGPRRPIDVEVEALPVLVDPLHISLRWHSCLQLAGARSHLCGVTTFDRAGRVLVVMHSHGSAA